MANETLSVGHDKQSEEILYPPSRWVEPQINVSEIEELIRSNRELEHFAFAVSHDLQEPLKVVCLYLQLLKRKYQERLDEKVEKDITSIIDRTERMQNLIQSMLDYARVGKGHAYFVRLDTSQVIHRAMDNLKASIDATSAQISCGNCPVVMGDEIQLTQLFQNLISNAIKFHQKGESPRIHIDVEQKDDQWVFSVRDNGIGVEQKDLQDIFKVFRRLHSHSEYAGNGIGLALCQRIVESHGGNIWVESEVGQGTTVYFNIYKIS